MVENYQLEQLLAFVMYGTLSAAAEKLHMTEPSFSRSMRRLEETLGVELFLHGKNRVSLTEAGHLAVSHAWTILGEVEKMVRHLRSFDRSHRLNLASCSVGALLELKPRAVRLYQNLIVSSLVKEEGLVQGLQEGDYDVILTPERITAPGIICEKFREDRLYLAVLRSHPLAVLRSHPLAGRESISFDDLDGQTFAAHPKGDMYTRLLMEKMPHSSFFFHENPDVLKVIAQDPTTPAFTSDIVLDNTKQPHPEQVNIPLSDPEARVTYYMACREEDGKRWEPLFDDIRRSRRTG